MGIGSFGSSEERMRLAQSRNLPDWIVEELAVDPDFDIIQVVFDSNHFSLSLLRESIEYIWSKNPNPDEPFPEGTEFINYMVICSQHSKQDKSKVLYDSVSPARSWVARCTEADSALLDTMARKEDKSWIAKHIAENPRTRTETLEFLSRYPDSKVREAVIRELEARMFD